MTRPPNVFCKGQNRFTEFFCSKYLRWLFASWPLDHTIAMYLEVFRNRVGLSFVFICLAVGGILIYAPIFDMINGERSKSWTTTEGTITESSLDVSEYVTFNGKYATRIESKSKKNIPNIVYTYYVDGKKLEGKRIAFGGITINSFLDYVSFHYEYSKGKIVMVYYSPNNPKLSVLVPGMQIRSYMPLAIGVMCVAMAVFVSTLMILVSEPPPESISGKTSKPKRKKRLKSKR